jgi:cellulose 1,4-beta-cellobiosidase
MTTKYQLFKLKIHEFTFTTDISNLPCRLNGIYYFFEMKEDGEKSKHPLEKPGVQYGMRYYDAQYPHEMKFINGSANFKDWKPKEINENS